MVFSSKIPLIAHIVQVGDCDLFIWYIVKINEKKRFRQPETAQTALFYQQTIIHSVICQFR